MLSGIASYLFGSTAEDELPEENDDLKLTTFPMENEWLLVDRAGMFDAVTLFLHQCCSFFLNFSLPGRYRHHHHHHHHHIYSPFSE